MISGMIDIRRCACRLAWCWFTWWSWCNLQDILDPGRRIFVNYKLVYTLYPFICIGRKW